MSTTSKSKTFIKKYWLFVIVMIVALFLAGLSIDIWFSAGDIQAKTITIFDKNGTGCVGNNYEFVSEYPILKALSSFFYTLAMSLGISLFILKVIQKDEDDRRKNEDDKRKDELARDVFKGVFDRLLPSEIYEVIKRDIFQSNVVRKNIQWTLDFEAEGNDLVLYKSIMFEIHNLKGKEHIENFYSVTTSTDYMSSEVQFLKWHEKEDEDNTTVLYDISKEVDTKEDGEAIIKTALNHSNVDVDFHKVDRDIVIPHNKVIVVNFKTKDMYKNNLDFVHDTMFTTACSSINWKMLVLFPKNYTFSVLPMFTKKLKPIADDKGRKSYAYDGAILKGQGIEFTLVRKND